MTEGGRHDSGVFKKPKHDLIPAKMPRQNGRKDNDNESVGYVCDIRVPFLEPFLQFSAADISPGLLTGQDDLPEKPDDSKSAKGYSCG